MKRGLLLLFVFVTTAALAFSRSDTHVIGVSVEGRPIFVHRHGPEEATEALVLMGGIHGLYEENTVELMRAYHEELRDYRGSVAIYIVENINPDSFFAQIDMTEDDPSGFQDEVKVGWAWERYNANYVDLNRNWPTGTWKQHVAYGAGVRRLDSGGVFSASEPEVQAVAAFLKRIQQHHDRVVCVNYHCYASSPRARGMAQPAYTGDWRRPEVIPAADHLARIYATAASYTYLSRWTDYEVPGEFLNWAGDQGILAVDVELANGASIYDGGANTSHLAANLRAVQSILSEMEERMAPRTAMR